MTRYPSNAAKRAPREAMHRREATAANARPTATVIYPQQATATDVLGGKASALARLTSAGFPVPPWLVVTPAAFAASATQSQRQALAQENRLGRLEDVFDAVTLASDVEQTLFSALQGIAGVDGTFAVRSSAVDEDTSEHSFAGQLESYLFVAPQNLARRIVDVWRSAFRPRVLAYRRENGLLLAPQVPAVIIQQMVDADLSGVAFSADPVSGKRSITVVGSLYGLGTALVSGEADADTHHVNTHGEIVHRGVVPKTVAHRFSAGNVQGVESIKVEPERSECAALSDQQILAVAELARQAERHFGRPQDIEWAIASGLLYLLQSRPITSLASLADPDGVVTIFDNSNIAESYSGITSPLTFSFVRNAYEGVYTQLSRILGVPDRRLQANRDALVNMIGLVRGRVYYNLLNWYRLLALIPGYKMNRAFLERMLGVEDPPPAHLVAKEEPSSLVARLVDALYFVRMLSAMLVNFFLLPWKRRHFLRRVDAALGSSHDNMSTKRAEDLVAAYQSLENDLIARWDAPQINDFFAMSFYGVLSRLCVKWCGDTDGNLQNGLLSGSGGMESTQPAERVRQMATIASRDNGLAEALRTAQPDEALAAIARNPEFQECFQSYLEKFGNRCPDELKLESQTLHENPLLLLRSVGFLAQPSREGSAGGEPCRIDGAATRRSCTAGVDEALSRRPIQRMLFGFVLSHTRRFVRGRENMRLQRTRVFGYVRRIFVALGERFYAQDLLNEPRDIFYLEKEEVIGFVCGTSTCTNLKELVALRKSEFAQFAAMQAPADRFETRGIVYQGNQFCLQPGADDTGGRLDTDEQRQGTGCCPGKVCGRVRVVLDPSQATLRQGDILVAKRTDPSWVMLFPFARGLLVQHGNLLSHSAIVARELGIPAIVSIPDVTRWLRDGDWVELDGATGVVRRIAPPTEGVS